MKKLAILAALTLAIGASVTAGTMARYTQDLGEKDAVVSTKQFKIVERAEELSFDVKPGDVVEKKITLDTSAVETDMMLSMDMYGLNVDLIKAIERAGGKFTITNSITGQPMTFRQGEEGLYAHQAVKSNVKKVVYTVRLDWSNHDEIMNDKITQLVQGKNTNFKVRIIGTQS